jgi:hypothetical protein
VRLVISFTSSESGSLPMTTSVVVWAFTDGKAGHENQTRGLIAAL